MREQVIEQFPFDRTSDELTFELPRGARPLSVLLLRGQPVLFVQLNPDAEKVHRRFRVVETGGRFTFQRAAYVGSFTLYAGEAAFHLFELLS